MEENKQKIRLQIIFTGFIFTCIIIIATTPLHEAAHWIMSEIDPYSEPIEFHLFDLSSQNGQNISRQPSGRFFLLMSFFSVSYQSKGFP